MKAILFGEKKKNVNNIIIIKILQRVQRTDDKKKKEKGQRDKMNIAKSNIPVDPVLYHSGYADALHDQLGSRQAQRPVHHV